MESPNTQKCQLNSNHMQTCMSSLENIWASKKSIQDKEDHKITKNHLELAISSIQMIILRKAKSWSVKSQQFNNEGSCMRVHAALWGQSSKIGSIRAPKTNS